MLEKDIVAAIRRYLATLGEDVFFWKEHGGAYGTSGVPDIICCYRGRFLGLEVKRPGGRLTPLQERTLARINAAGGIARRVESVEDVKDIIRQADGGEENANDGKGISVPGVSHRPEDKQQAVAGDAAAGGGDELHGNAVGYAPAGQSEPAANG